MLHLTQNLPSCNRCLVGIYCLSESRCWDIAVFWIWMQKWWLHHISMLGELQTVKSASQNATWTVWVCLWCAASTSWVVTSWWDKMRWDKMRWDKIKHFILLYFIVHFHRNLFCMQCADSHIKSLWYHIKIQHNKKTRYKNNEPTASKQQRKLIQYCWSYQGKTKICFFAKTYKSQLY